MNLNDTYLPPLRPSAGVRAPPAEPDGVPAPGALHQRPRRRLQRPAPLLPRGRPAPGFGGPQQVAEEGEGASMKECQRETTLFQELIYSFKASWI